jgi:hypothetical protein
MHIGIDFDNTIVNYNGVFYQVGVEQGIIPNSLNENKNAVRNYLRNEGKESVWTELQGYVYGMRMSDAAFYPGFLDFLAWTKSFNIPVSIISHKTKYPFLGPQYDLHTAARAWIKEFLHSETEALINMDNVYFEITKDAKWARIKASGVTCFIDDLPEILLSDSFPSAVEGILFDPDRHHDDQRDKLKTMNNWSGLLEYLKLDVN